MKVIDLLEDDAKLICNWKYEDEYAIYNLQPWEKIKEQKWSIADEKKRKEQYRKIIDEDKFIGYFRVQELNDKIVLGLGMNPEFCGQGNGTLFMDAILDYLKERNKVIELEVREFNKRAIKCYKKVGFKEIDRCEKNTLNGKDVFIVMQKKL